jgi:hypothetical protein
MNSRQEKTLAAIFEKPPRNDIRWAAFESLVKALGGMVTAGSGSHRRIVLGKLKFSLVKPHPKSILKVYQVRELREKLEILGITP